MAACSETLVSEWAPVTPGGMKAPVWKVATASWLLVLLKSRPTFLAPVSSSSTNSVSKSTLCTGTSIWAILSFRLAIRSGDPLRMIAFRRRSTAIELSTD